MKTSIQRTLWQLTHTMQKLTSLPDPHRPSYRSFLFMDGELYMMK